MSNGSGMFSDQSAVKRHLVEGKTGVAGEVNDLRNDVGRTIAGLLAMTIDEYINSPADDPDALLLAQAIPETATTYNAAQGELTGVLSDGIIDVDSAGPRQVVFTTAGATPADAPANCTIVGKDGAGRLLTETVALAQTATTATSNNFFAAVDELQFEAADGSAHTIAVGFGGDLGLRQEIKSRAGALNVNKEINAGTVLAADAITATFSNSTASPPFGSVDPTTAVNGANDYAYEYEYDPTVTA